MTNPAIDISTDKTKLDIRLVHQFLTHSYWAKNRTLAQVEKSIQNSICYGVYLADQQIGFARVITDQVIFAYIADVFIVESQRGRGISKKLMNTLLSDPALEEVKSWYLITEDAQGVYEKVGFEIYNDPVRTIMFRRKEERQNGHP